MSNEADGTGGDASPGTGDDSRAAGTAEELDQAQRERAEKEHAESLGERLSHQLSQQWAQLRAERRNEPVAITGGPSNFTRAQVPWALDLAAAWSWRLLIIAAGAYVVLWLMAFFAVVTLPLVIAMFIAALANPIVHGMRRIGIPQGLAAGLVSAVAELSQLFSTVRYPSGTDVFYAVVGALAGGLASLVLKKRR